MLYRRSVYATFTLPTETLYLTAAARALIRTLSDEEIVEDLREEADKEAKRPVRTEDWPPFILYCDTTITYQ